MDGRFPLLGGATAWLNSEPLGPAALRGRVVLVNFWTWTCINWLRQEPYVRAWSQAYRDDGLVVIGVHTPELSFEHDVEGLLGVERELLSVEGLGMEAEADWEHLRDLSLNHWARAGE